MSTMTNVKCTYVLCVLKKSYGTPFKSLAKNLLTKKDYLIRKHTENQRGKTTCVKIKIMSKKDSILKKSF